MHASKHISFLSFVRQQIQIKHILSFSSQWMDLKFWQIFQQILRDKGRWWIMAWNATGNKNGFSNANYCNIVFIRGSNRYCDSYNYAKKLKKGMNEMQMLLFDPELAISFMESHAWFCIWSRSRNCMVIWNKWTFSYLESFFKRGINNRAELQTFHWTSAWLAYFLLTSEEKLLHSYQKFSLSNDIKRKLRLECI